MVRYSALAVELPACVKSLEEGGVVGEIDHAILVQVGTSAEGDGLKGIENGLIVLDKLLVIEVDGLNDVLLIGFEDAESAFHGGLVDDGCEAVAEGFEVFAEAFERSSGVADAGPSPDAGASGDFAFSDGVELGAGELEAPGDLSDVFGGGDEVGGELLVFREEPAGIGEVAGVEGHILDVGGELLEVTDDLTDGVEELGVEDGESLKGVVEGVQGLAGEGIDKVDFGGEVEHAVDFGGGEEGVADVHDAGEEEDEVGAEAFALGAAGVGAVDEVLRPGEFSEGRRVAG